MTSITSSLGTSYSSSVLSLDTNGDGVVSAEELAAADKDSKRTQDPTVETESAASGVSSQVSGSFMAAMINGPMDGAPSGEPPLSPSEMFAGMDTDGDGTVTEAEFVDGRPEEMTEEMASELFAALDTEGTGSLTEEQYVAAFESQPPMGPPPPPPSDAEGEESSDTVSLADLLEQMSSIVEQYRALTEEEASADSAGSSISV